MQLAAGWRQASPRQIHHQRRNEAKHAHGFRVLCAATLLMRLLFLVLIVLLSVSVSTFSLLFFFFLLHYNSALFSTLLEPVLATSAPTYVPPQQLVMCQITNMRSSIEKTLACVED